MVNTHPVSLVFCRALLAGAVLAWLAPAAARAEPVWKVGGSVNTLAGGNLDRDSAAGCGLQLDYVHNDLLSLELSLSRYDAKTNDPDHPGQIARDDLTAGVLSVRVHPLTAPAPERAYAGADSPSGWKVLRPYLDAGGGFYGIRESRSGMGAAADTTVDMVRFRCHVGAGTDFVLGEHAELFLDYRYVFVNLAANDFNHGLARLGLNVVF